MNSSCAPGAIGCSTRLSVGSAIGSGLRCVARIPYAVLAIPLRFAVATVFWNSAMAKLANWETTIALFTDDYKVPLIPPEIAAYLATSIELSAPVLLVLGLLTRPAAFVLLGMVAVIEIFVYPQAWPTHLQWAAMLLILLSRGAGKLSVDYVIWRRLSPKSADACENPEL